MENKSPRRCKFCTQIHKSLVSDLERSGKSFKKLDHHRIPMLQSIQRRAGRFGKNTTKVVITIEINQVQLYVSSNSSIDIENEDTISVVLQRGKKSVASVNQELFSTAASSVINSPSVATNNQNFSITSWNQKLKMTVTLYYDPKLRQFQEKFAYLKIYIQKNQIAAASPMENSILLEEIALPLHQYVLKNLQEYDSRQDLYFPLTAASLKGSYVELSLGSVPFLTANHPLHAIITPTAKVAHIVHRQHQDISRDDSYNLSLSSSISADQFDSRKSQRQSVARAILSGDEDDEDEEDDIAERLSSEYIRFEHDEEEELLGIAENICKPPRIRLADEFNYEHIKDTDTTSSLPVGAVCEHATSPSLGSRVPLSSSPVNRAILSHRKSAIVEQQKQLSSQYQYQEPEESLENGHEHEQSNSKWKEGKQYRWSLAAIKLLARELQQYKNQVKLLQSQLNDYILQSETQDPAIEPCISTSEASTQTAVIITTDKAVHAIRHGREKGVNTPSVETSNICTNTEELTAKHTKEIEIQTDNTPVESVTRRKSLKRQISAPVEANEYNEDEANTATTTSSSNFRELFSLTNTPFSAGDKELLKKKTRSSSFAASDTLINTSANATVSSSYNGSENHLLTMFTPSNRMRTTSSQSGTTDKKSFRLDANSSAVFSPRDSSVLLDQHSVIVPTPMLDSSCIDENLSPYYFPRRTFRMQSGRPLIRGRRSSSRDYESSINLDEGSPNTLQFCDESPKLIPIENMSSTKETMQQQSFIAIESSIHCNNSRFVRSHLGQGEQQSKVTTDYVQEVVESNYRITLQTAIDTPVDDEDDIIYREVASVVKEMVEVIIEDFLLVDEYVAITPINSCKEVVPDERNTSTLNITTKESSVFIVDVTLKSSPTDTSAYVTTADVMQDIKLLTKASPSTRHSPRGGNSSHHSSTPLLTPPLHRNGVPTTADDTMLDEYNHSTLHTNNQAMAYSRNKMVDHACSPMDLPLPLLVVRVPTPLGSNQQSKSGVDVATSPIQELNGLGRSPNGGGAVAIASQWEEEELVIISDSFFKDENAVKSGDVVPSKPIAVSQQENQTSFNAELQQDVTLTTISDFTLTTAESSFNISSPINLQNSWEQQTVTITTVTSTSPVGNDPANFNNTAEGESFDREPLQESFPEEGELTTNVSHESLVEVKNQRESESHHTSTNKPSIGRSLRTSRMYQRYNKTYNKQARLSSSGKSMSAITKDIAEVNQAQEILVDATVIGSQIGEETLNEEVEASVLLPAEEISIGADDSKQLDAKESINDTIADHDTSFSTPTARDRKSVITGSAKKPNNTTNNTASPSHSFTTVTVPLTPPPTTTKMIKKKHSYVLYTKPTTEGSEEDEAEGSEDRLVQSTSNAKTSLPPKKTTAAVNQVVNKYKIPGYALDPEVAASITTAHGGKSSIRKGHIECKEMLLAKHADDATLFTTTLQQLFVLLTTLLTSLRSQASSHQQQLTVEDDHMERKSAQQHRGSSGSTTKGSHDTSSNNKKIRFSLFSSSSSSRRSSSSITTTASASSDSHSATHMSGSAKAEGVTNNTQHNHAEMTQKVYALLNSLSTYYYILYGETTNYIDTVVYQQQIAQQYIGDIQDYQLQIHELQEYAFHLQSEKERLQTVPGQNSPSRSNSFTVYTESTSVHSSPYRK